MTTYRELIKNRGSGIENRRRRQQQQKESLGSLEVQPEYEKLQIRRTILQTSNYTFFFVIVFKIENIQKTITKDSIHRALLSKL